jgi:Na+-transporting methylmalonyl-CoA/oxaloacetate decarboxylase beta subunit
MSRKHPTFEELQAAANQFLAATQGMSAAMVGVYGITLTFLERYKTLPEATLIGLIGQACGADAVEVSTLLDQLVDRGAITRVGAEISLPRSRA